ncbi:MAG: MASE1 domain-containing protein [Clostridiales bacterium]|nr:MASE1 domain-containing protein [Clostridiales bacterium]
MGEKNEIKEKKLMLKIFFILLIFYLVSARIGMYFALEGTIASVIWIPSGIGFTAIILYGYRVWPSLFLGAFLINLYMMINLFDQKGIVVYILIALIIAIGNTSEAIIGKVLLNRFSGFKNKFQDTKRNLKSLFLIMIAVFIASLIGAVCNSILINGSFEQFFQILYTWWFGDFAGIILVLPLTLLYKSQEEKYSFKMRAIPEMMFFFFIYTLLIVIALLKFEISKINITVYFYFLIFFVIWALFRYTIVEMSIIILIFLSAASYATLHNFGPFASDNLNDSLIALQGFVVLLVMFSSYIKYTIEEQKKQQLIIEENYRRLKAFSDIQDKMQRELILAMINILEVHDPYTKGHSQNVADMSKKLAEKLELSEFEINQAYWAGLIHDIGKILIPKNILNKPGKLTEEEFTIVKDHPTSAKIFLSNSKELDDIARYIYHHHERWDGKGYPDGIKGKDIPLISQVISIVDAFDAMTSERKYRKCLTREEVIAEMKTCSGKQFSPELVEPMVEIINERV